MNRKRERKNLRYLVTAIVVVLIVVVAWLGVSATYRNGFEAGKAAQHDATASDLSALGQAVEEKTKTLSSLAELNASTPDEATSESIDDYIEKLSRTIERVSNEEVKAVLGNYKGAWEKFKEVYASEDNSAIEAALSDLRSSASDTSIKVTEIYNRLITDASRKLPE